MTSLLSIPWFYVCIFLSPQEIPLKPAQEFELTIDLQLKQRMERGESSIAYSNPRNEQKKGYQGPLPYLYLNLTFRTLQPGEDIIKLLDHENKQILRKKCSLTQRYILDLGYTDDIKDGITSQKYTVLLISNDKTETSRIVIAIDHDGHFTVNGELRGKF